MKNFLLVLTMCLSSFAEDLTISGIPITIEGRLNRPQPTLFVFAGSRADTLNASNPYNDVGRILQDSKWLIVTMDLPAHGTDARQGETDPLYAWRTRQEAGEEIVSIFTNKCKTVLDYLIANRYSNPRKVFVAGTSRGGFMAAHFAIADKRIRAVAAFAPVTTVLALSEYANSSFPVGVIPPMTLSNYATQLSGINLKMWSGPNDTRVGTQNALNLVSAVQSIYLYSNIEVRIQPAVDHTVPVSAHEEASDWLKGFK